MDFRLGSRPDLYPSHPMTPQNLRSDLHVIDVRHLWRLRSDGNCPLPTRLSATCASVAASPKSSEFVSVSTMRDNVRKHTRSTFSPIDKYNFGAATSHEIGWHVEAPRAATAFSAVRRPLRFGLKESETTRYVHSMKLSGSEASLRLILP
ncbi:unnamed protein product [Durusdinium trenchii]|uniref:Uncharacterized protein n=2 Tax=Durusdinium trenchii TaxID=1381693 RepID=A0ABP0LDR6_9DINO